MNLGVLDRPVTASRVRGYSLLLVAGYVLGVIWWLYNMHEWVDPFGKPLGYDFITFYAASDLARLGDPAGAYDISRIFDAERAAVPANESVFLWHYPPPFQLLIAPLAFMPYGLALTAWLATTLGLYLALIRKISDHRGALLIALAFPAVFVNGMHGQNGFLNTAILGFGLLLLDRRPWLAGVLLGLLIYKPHFGVLLPFLLAVQGRWKSFLAAGATAVVFCALAYGAYGLEPWLAFVENFRVVSRVLEGRILPWPKIPSVFVMVAYSGVPLAVAYAVHAAVALILAGLTLYAWRKPGPQVLKVALAIPAILMVSPYCFDYDLVLLAIPIALTAEYGRHAVLPAGTRAALALGFVTPLAFTTIAAVTSVQLMPIAILLLYAAIWRTLAQARAPQAGALQASADLSTASTASP